MRIHEYPSMGMDEAQRRQDAFNIKLVDLDTKYCSGCGARFWKCERETNSCGYWHETALSYLWTYITMKHGFVNRLRSNMKEIDL